MNETILKRAQREIAENRDRAFTVCEKNLDILRAQSDWNKCEQALRKAQMTFGLSEGIAHEQAAKDMSALKERRKQLLKKYGMTEQDLTPRYSCKLCNDEGYVDGQRCKCLKSVLRRILTSQSRVDAEKTFADSQERDKHNKAVYRETAKLCRGKRNERNLLLLGKTGTGKTYLLMSAANECIAAEQSVLFVTAYALNRQFLEYHTADIRDKKPLMDSLTDADVLIIDDLGSENILRNVTQEYLFVLLNERLNDKKRTFISTNLTIQQLRDRYDERIFSRLVDRGITFTAELVNNDKRVSGGD